MKTGKYAIDNLVSYFCAVLVWYGCHCFIVVGTFDYFVDKFRADWRRWYVAASKEQLATIRAETYGNMRDTDDVGFFLEASRVRYDDAGFSHSGDYVFMRSPCLRIDKVIGIGDKHAVDIITEAVLFNGVLGAQK